MQLVQELKFSYDTNLDPEIDEIVEQLVFLVHAKGGMIKDHVVPNRGGATIVNRPDRSSNGTGSITDWPGKINIPPQPEKKSRFIGTAFGITDKGD